MRRTQTLDCQTGAFPTCLALLQVSHISFHHPSIIPFWNDKGRPATFIWVVPLSFYWMSANLVYTSPWCFCTTVKCACGWERRNRVRERVCSFSTVSINLRWTEKKRIVYKTWDHRNQMCSLTFFFFLTYICSHAARVNSCQSANVFWSQIYCRSFWMNYCICTVVLYILHSAPMFPFSLYKLIQRIKQIVVSD